MFLKILQDAEMSSTSEARVFPCEEQAWNYAQG